MPRRDGTGPMGSGTMTGRGFEIDSTASKTQKDLLNAQKALLKESLEAVDKQLESL